VSAVPSDAPRLARMTEADLDAVVELENSVYSHPWTRGNFGDSLRAGYDCWTWRSARELLGYFMLAAAAGEAHLLNLSVAPARQREGHGSAMLRAAMRVARERGACDLYLEVRPGNLPAQALYARFGFSRIAVRRGYYPGHAGREDALVYRIEL
jgi:ribosomal-protein-alanine N-acetyltransferase